MQFAFGSLWSDVFRPRECASSDRVVFYKSEIFVFKDSQFVIAMPQDRILLYSFLEKYAFQ